MKAHDDMGQPEINITYEDIRRAAEANGISVQQTLENIAKTAAKDRTDHPLEYSELYTSQLHNR